MKTIYDVLADLDITYTEYEHAPAHTVEEAKAIYKDIPGGQVRNVFLRDKKGREHFLVILPAEKPFDPAIIREKYDTSKLGGAMEYELEKYLGVKPGAVSPFALINDADHHVRVVVDEAIYQEENQHFHPLKNTASLLIKTTDLDRFLDWTGNPWEKMTL